MVLDNSKAHKSQVIKDFLKENPRLRFVYLPKYSPELNPVEGLWKWLKQDVVNNVFFSKFYQIRSHVAEFMKQASQKSQKVIDRLLVRLELSKNLSSSYIVCNNSNKTAVDMFPTKQDQPEPLFSVECMALLFLTQEILRQGISTPATPLAFSAL